MGLGRVTDHQEINIAPDEYKRIEKNLKMYQNNWPRLKYINSNGEKRERKYMSLNMHKYVSDTIASLIWSEACQIDIANVQIKGFVEEVLNDNKFDKVFSQNLESCFALGGLCASPSYNPENGRIELRWVHAPSFFPLKSNTSHIDEVAIASKFSRVAGGNTIYYTILEFHRWRNGDYIIGNELYRSLSPDEVGELVEWDDALGLQSMVFEGLQRPLFSYLKPAGFNNINFNSPLGLSILDNSHNTIVQINDAYDQFNWEIKSGQRRIAVSDHFTTTSYDEVNKRTTAIFDEDTNVFLKFRTDSDEMFVEDLTHDIRAEQYTAAINQLFKTMEMEIKLSPGTFSYDGRSMKTATEVVSEDSLTFRTRTQHLKNVEEFLKSLIISICELGNASGIYGGPIPTFDEIGINFDDGVFSSRDSKLSHYSQAVTFNLMPRVEAIQRVFKVSRETAEEWLHLMRMEEIHANPEARAAMASVALFGEDEIAGANVMRMMSVHQENENE